MKTFFGMLLHVLYCALLPFSIVCFFIAAIFLCYPEDFVGADHYIIYGLVACLPAWLYQTVGYVGWATKVVTPVFVRTLLKSHATILLILFCAMIILSLIAPARLGNLLIFALVSAACLLPHGIALPLIFGRKRIFPE